MFVPGDCFQVINNNLRGQVVDIIDVQGYPHYKVQWEGFATPAFYNVDEINSCGDWTKISTYKNSPNATPVATPECSHELVEYVGFSDSYKYCKKCEKKESEL